MRYQLNKLRVDFSQTPIENLFLDTYLPIANENQLKVYLYGYKNAVNNISNENSDIGKFLNISDEEVEKAWDFWKSTGLVEEKEVDNEKVYIFKSIRILYRGLDKEYEIEEEKEENEEETIISNKDSTIEEYRLKSEKLSKMHQDIEDYLSMDQATRIALDPRDVRRLNELVENYEVEPYFVSYAYHLASEVNDFKSKNPAYVSKVIENWIKYENIKTTKDLDEYIEKRSKKKEEIRNQSYNKKKKRTNNEYKDDRLSKDELRNLIQEKLRQSMED